VLALNIGDEISIIGQNEILRNYGNVDWQEMSYTIFFLVVPAEGGQVYLGIV